MFREIFLMEASRDTIFVKTISQANLLENVLFGQFSDGRWENSKNQSWRFWNSCNVEVSNEQGYIKSSSYRGETSYKCDDAELISAIGGSMIALSRISIFLKRVLTEEEVIIINAIIGWDGQSDLTYKITEEGILRLQKSYVEKNPKRLQNMNVFFRKYKLPSIVKALNSGYNLGDLNKDLKEITKSMKNKIE